MGAITALRQVAVLVLGEGQRQKLFRADLDVKKVYLSMAALGYFYLSNRYTLSSFLGDDLMKREQCDAWLEEITRIVLASVRAEPVQAKRLPAPRKAALVA